MYVERILKDLAINYIQVQVGEIQLHSELKEEKKQDLSVRLQEIGLDLIDNCLNQLIEKTKKACVGFSKK
jgi:hypothetical protein